MLTVKEYTKIRSLKARRAEKVSGARSYADWSRRYCNKPVSPKQAKIFVREARKHIAAARKANSEIVAIKQLAAARKHSVVFDTVYPLIEEARVYAANSAERTVSQVRAMVNERGFDAVAPECTYPDRHGRSVWDKQYQAERKVYDDAQAKRSFVKKLMDDAGAARYVEEQIDNAIFQYLMFAYKMEQKAGPAVEASLDGSHVWGFSHLTVKHADGTVAIWRTQQIENVSVLGKHFPQWPSRVVKAVQS